MIDESVGATGLAPQRRTGRCDVPVSLVPTPPSVLRSCATLPFFGAGEPDPPAGEADPAAAADADADADADESSGPRPAAAAGPPRRGPARGPARGALNAATTAKKAAATAAAEARGSKRSGAELSAAPQGALLKLLKVKMRAARFVKDLLGTTLTQRAKGRVVVAFKNKHVAEARRVYRQREVRVARCTGAGVFVKKAPAASSVCGWVGACVCMGGDGACTGLLVVIARGWGWHLFRSGGG